nr:class I SAM-dependent methyltransferase [Aliidiomarina indica]
MAEQTIYQQHENNPNDPGYRKFLGRTLNAVVPHLPAQASGLDFGSGPGPTLHLMFQEHGFPCTTYDVYFDPVPERLAATYDFITATEVFEHLAHPHAVLTQLFHCLAPSGVLAIMTQKPTTKEAFSRWQYCLDPTHITFYRDATFDWMSRHLKAPIVHRGRDVVVFQKSAVD